MNSKVRAVVAFAVAPVSFGILGFVVSALRGATQEGIWFFGFSAVVGYPIAAVLAAPLYFFLRRHSWNGLLVYFVVSLIFALILTIGFVLLPMYMQSGLAISELTAGPRLAQVLMLSVAALLSVLVFWVIARPDKEN